MSKAELERAKKGVCPELIVSVMKTAVSMFSSQDNLSYESLTNLVVEAIASTDGNFGVQEAVKWAAGYEFPQELVDSDLRLFRASQLDFNKMVERRLKKLGLKPLRLQSKEGLGLINGTQFMSAYAVHCLLRIQNVAKTADIAAAMTLEAARGSAAPYDARIHAARPHQGQMDVAKNLRQLLRGSKILPSHANCAKVQDPYSLRCVPQVHGAVRLAYEHARAVVETEINSATDNPLVFENGDIVSGGNFHGEPLAFILDYLAIATAEIASIAERRIYMLLHGDTIGDLKVPRLLMKDTGLNSGFMIPQYTAAALVSENKIFAHPASVDSIPSSLGQEDHVSMGSISATKLLEVVKNTETVLAIEFMCSAQGLEFLRPLQSGRGVEAAFTEVRRYIPFAQADRLFHHDVQTALALVRSEQIASAVQRAAGKLL